MWFIYQPGTSYSFLHSLIRVGWNGDNLVAYRFYKRSYGIRLKVVESCETISIDRMKRNHSLEMIEISTTYMYY